MEDIAARGSAAQDVYAVCFDLGQIVVEDMFCPGSGAVIVLALEREEPDVERSRVVVGQSHKEE